MKEFSSDYDKKIYGRDVAKKLKMNQKTASNILNRLEIEGILKFSVKGRNKYYFLNKFNQNIKEILKLIEISKKIEFLKEYHKIKGLFEEIEKRTNGVAVIFGSYSKGTANERSDLDVFVIGKINDTNDLERQYSIKINIIKINAGKFNKEEIFIKEVINSHIILKGVEEFMELIWQV